MSISIVWRYLVFSYIKTFFLSVSAFILTLLISRFKEMTRFAALSGDMWVTVLFIFYQIPLILPLAIPISSLIGAFLLYQRLSRNSELIALRACGMSIQAVLTPVLMTSLLIGLANFALCIEGTPYFRRATKRLLYSKTSKNPLFLLERQKLIQLKHSYLNMHVTQEGKQASDLIVILPYGKQHRLQLFSLKNLDMEDDVLVGTDGTLISYTPSNTIDSFDPLFIETQSTLKTDASLLSQILKKNRPSTDLSSLSLKMLCIQKNQPSRKGLIAQTEIFRRISLGIAVFSFTLIGVSYGIETGRRAFRKNSLVALSLSIGILFGYLFSKEMKAAPFLSFVICFVPHLAVCLFCLRHLFRLSRGN